MTTEADTLLRLLRERAIARRNARAEMRENRLADKDVPMECLKSWPPLAHADEAVAEAMREYEISEGVYE